MIRKYGRCPEGDGDEETNRRVDMNNALKAMTMNSHLKIASVLALSIGALAVGFVAGNRGGGGGVVFAPQDKPTLV